MKFIVAFPFILSSFFINAQYAEPCAEIPELNQSILNVLKPYLGKKILRGECWDAAKLALNEVGAEWDGLYNFGRKIDLKKECIQPGDIVQFEKAELTVVLENGSYSESFYHHTAIVYSVKSAGELQILHQNTGQFGKKMGVTELNLATITKGTFTIYRPVGK